MSAYVQGNGSPLPASHPATSFQPDQPRDDEYAPPPGPPPGWTSATQPAASHTQELPSSPDSDLPEVVPGTQSPKSLPEIAPDAPPPSNLPEAVSVHPPSSSLPEAVPLFQPSSSLPEVVPHPQPSRNLPQVVPPALPPRQSQQRFSAVFTQPSPPADAPRTRPVSMQIPRKPTAQPPSPVSTPTATSANKAVTSCIDFLASFPTTWYWHPEAPAFFICSRCYLDHLQWNPAGSSLQSAYFTDGAPRICLCSLPRMKTRLLPQAVAAGSLHPALEYMRFRPNIQACKGVDGIKGGQGHRWYKAEGDSIPGFFACQACFEDYVFPTYFARKFEQVPEGRQGPNEIWACDIASRYVLKHMEQKSKTNNWPGFVTEAKARLSISRCPGPNPVPTHGLSWFMPKEIRGLAACPACFCDQVLWTDEDAKWREVTEWKVDRRQRATCCFAQLNLKLCIERAHDLEDYSGFWAAAKRLSHVPVCSPQGIKNGQWYTLRSDPTDFRMCKACHITIAESLQVSQHFVPKIGLPKTELLLCSFNPAHGRMPQFLSKLIEVYMKADPSPLSSFASVWAKIPLCPRDQDKSGMHWYGWPGCTICPECHLNFTSKYSNMCRTMDYQDALIPQATLCEMYSPRMRDIFKQVAAAGPSGLPALFQAVAQRRIVYTQTVPQMRNIIAHQKSLLGQQEMLNTQSTFHMVKGHMDQISYGTPYTYSAAGVGSGFANMDLLKSAQLRQETFGMVAGAQNATWEVAALEKQWRAVE
uniref:Integral membrane protein n=1 Tax=Bionectria ochroleuca TaxID=29856 RepID=A0A8H7K5M6_BIOOC